LVSSSGTALSTALTTDSATATLGTKEQTVTMPATGSVTVVAYATVATAVTGLAAPIGSVSATIVVRDVVSELAVVNAALAAERAARAADKIASDKAIADAKASSDSATATLKAENEALKNTIADLKTKFNALAKKWNAKFPKLKVNWIK